MTLQRLSLPSLAWAASGRHFYFNRIKGKYENSIWLVISQTYSLEKLQAALAMKLKLYEVVNERVNEVTAAELIHARLETTKSLIVLDDVWRATMQENLISALGLPTGDNTHCKIVLTTRSKYVCTNMNARVYELHPLSEEESWDLFCAFAFQGNQPPHHLEGIARQIEKECGRSPLIVKTVAASLANDILSVQWTSELEQLRVVSYTEDPVMQILLLSYISLPAYLKPCFAFLAFFQEDVKIDSQYIINLWIAEELIPESADQQDTGWSYIYHLQNLCLVEMTDDIQVPQKRWLKLHDLLLDLAISISEQSKCAFSVEKASMKSPAEQTRSRYQNYRRILLAGKGINDRTIAESSVASLGSVKTLSIYDNDISTIPEQFFASMELLRILDLSSTHISTLPESVANLRHLRLLNLGRTKIRHVPKCIRKLANLRFLYISECTELTRLPEWIGELKYLEHLKVAGCSDELASHMPAGISMLFSLQTLTSDYLNLSIQDNKLLKLEHVVSLTRLEELCINVNHIEELEAIYEGVLEQLVKLRSLAIANEIPPMEFKNAADLPSSLPESMKAMENIEKLFLWNFSVPSWCCSLIFVLDDKKESASSSRILT
ncbi:hypothetical protein SUGI_0369780 [Cryptomeria japonica]|nr:hypothetical protein SUGI_0369780 [Cryptomeria japonica]